MSMPYIKDTNIKSIVKYFLIFIIGSFIAVYFAPKIDILSNKETKNLKKDNERLIKENDKLLIQIETRDSLINKRNVLIDQNELLLRDKDIMIKNSDITIKRLESDIKSISEKIKILKDEYEKIDIQEANRFNSIDKFSSDQQYKYFSDLFQDRIRD